MVVDPPSEGLLVERAGRRPVGDAQVGGDLGDAGPRSCEALRRGGDQAVRGGAALRDRGCEQLEAPRRRGDGEALDEPVRPRSPDLLERNPKIPQLRGGQPQDGGRGARPQTDPRGASARREHRHLRGGVGACDHELLLGEPDQVDAAVGDDPSAPRLIGLVLPRARRQRTETVRCRELAVESRHGARAQRRRSVQSPGSSQGTGVVVPLSQSRRRIA